MKNTYGTGAFLLFTLGNEPKMSEHGLIATVAWKLGSARPVYALEGAVAIAGALVHGCVTTSESSATRVKSRLSRARSTAQKAWSSYLRSPVSAHPSGATTHAA